MGVIYLVRHGQADSGAYGIDTGTTPVNGPGGLTEAGMRQAHLTGALLASQTPQITAAFSGDLPRQTQTLAAVLSNFPDAPEPVVDRAWNEYDLPVLAGTATAEDYLDGRRYQQQLDAGLHDWISHTTKNAGGETYPAFRDRVRAAAERACAAAGSGQTVVVASSAGTITAWLAALWQIPDLQWPRMSRTMVNASVTKLLVGASGVNVVSINEHAHLAGSAHDLATFR